MQYFICIDCTFAKPRFQQFGRYDIIVSDNDNAPVVRWLGGKMAETFNAYTANGSIENIDYVEINGVAYTPASLDGYISVKRDETFDRPMTAYPVASESRKAIRTDKLTETERYALDHSPYNFDDSIGEPRFKTEFDYYGALMRAVQSNLDAVYVLKRSIAAQTRYIESTYNEIYDECRINGKLDRGKNDSDRRAWFRHMYPALVKCRDMLRAFLEEIEIEEERLKQFASSTSRVITSTETSYSAQGKLWNLRNA